MSDIRCSFCGIERERSQAMISGPRVYICGDCVQLCAQIVFEQRDFAGPIKEISGHSIACMWCDAQLDDREAAREHTATCARHPAVIALRARDGAP